MIHGFEGFLHDGKKYILVRWLGDCEESHLYEVDSFEAGSCILLEPYPDNYEVKAAGVKKIYDKDLIEHLRYYPNHTLKSKDLQDYAPKLAKRETVVKITDGKSTE